jgi:hypothetical protein
VSAVYLYGITDRPAPVSDGLRAVELDSLAAVYAPAASGEQAATEEALWAHEAVVERLLEAGPVLPARFRTLLDDPAQLEDELGRRKQEFRTALDFVRDRVELGVRAAWPERRPAARSDESGSAYLARKLSERQAAALAAGELHEPLASIAVSSAIEIEHAPCLALVGSYLVERDEVDAFRAEAERLAEEIQDVHLACTGPWPPYTFTGSSVTA